MRPKPWLGRTRSAPLRSPLNGKPSGRSFISLLLVACCELASPAWAGGTPTARLVHWATDVRPALESVVCVALQERNGRSVFQPSIAEPPGCPGPLPSDPMFARVAHLLASRGVLARAKVGDPSKAFGGIPVDAGHVSVAEQAYRTMVLAHPYLQDRLIEAATGTTDCQTCRADALRLGLFVAGEGRGRWRCVDSDLCRYQRHSRDQSARSDPRGCRLRSRVR